VTSPFRDSFDSCPRCGTDLVDAKAARGCQGCRGLWVDEVVLAEMIIDMLPPPPRVLGRLALVVMQRAGEALACPACKTPMEPTAIHGVELDRCPKQHGVWFDADELRIALQRVADPHNPPPLRESAEPVPIAPRAPRPAAPRPPPSSQPSARQVTFAVTAPGGRAREVTLQRDIIKIGKLASSHLRVEGDDAVSRMHAVIEVLEDKLDIIDLGSSVGTLVNGERVTKQQLQVGDRIQVGDTLIELRAVSPAR